MTPERLVELEGYTRIGWLNDVEGQELISACRELMAENEKLRRRLYGIEHLGLND